MKKFGIATLIIILLFALAYAGIHSIAKSLLDPQNIAQQTTQILGTPITVEETPVFSLFPPEINFSRLNWKGGEGNISWDINAPEGRIKFELAPLFYKNIVISDILLNNPLILIREQTTSVSETRKPIANSQPDSFDNSSSISLQINRLLTSNGELIWKWQDSSVTLANLNIAFQNLYNFKETSLQSDFEIYMKTGHEILTGNMAFKTRLTYCSPHINFSNAAITFAPTNQTEDLLPPSIALSMDGTLNISDLRYRITQSRVGLANSVFTILGEGDIGKRYFSGEINAQIKSAPLPENGNGDDIVLKSTIHFKNNSFLLPDITGSWNDCAGFGQLQINLPDASSPIKITGDIKADELVLPDDIFEPKTERDQNRQVANNKSSEIKSLHIPDMNLHCYLSGLKWKNSSFGPIDVKLNGKNNIITINPLKIDWVGGKIMATGDFAADTGDIKLNLTGTSLELGSSLKQFGYNGITNGITDISVSLAGNGLTVSELLSSLGGKLTLASKDVEIDILKKIDQSLPFLKNTKFDIPDKVQELTGICILNRGIIYCKPVDLKFGKLNASGMLTYDAIRDNVNGNISLDAFGAILPLNFKGSLQDISWHTGQGFFDQLRKLFP